MSKSGYILSLSVLFLFSIGLVMVFNTTSAEVLDKGLTSNTHNALYKQIFHSLIGITLGLVLFFFGYERTIRYAPVFFFGCIFLLLLVFIPKIGQEINGAKRWIHFSSISMQPSEFAKYIIPIYFIYRIRKEKKIDLKQFMQIISWIVIPTALILMEPDNGTTAIILLMLMILFILSRIPVLYWAVPAVFVLIVGGVAAYHMPHVPDRIRIYLHPELDLQGKGHQPHQSKIAAGSGGLWGRGPGESLQKLNYLPEARCDYIAAIYAEEFGFVGIGLLISIYMIIAFTGFQIAASSLNRSGFLLAAVITFLIAFQAFLNLGVVSNLLPSKGTTLPFISQGGSSLIANIMGLFLLLSIASPVKKRVRAS